MPHLPPELQSTADSPPSAKSARIYTPSPDKHISYS
jgi:hypothetical protein